jgi:hypothetical protein
MSGERKHAVPFVRRTCLLPFEFVSGSFPGLPGDPSLRYRGKVSSRAMQGIISYANIYAAGHNGNVWLALRLVRNLGQAWVTDQFRVQITSSSWSDSRIQSSFDTSCASLFSSATLEGKRRHAVYAHLGLKLLETITLDFASGALLGVFSRRKSQCNPRVRSPL